MSLSNFHPISTDSKTCPYVFQKFISCLAITAPISLIPEFIRQDCHMDLLSWRRAASESRLLWRELADYLECWASQAQHQPTEPVGWC